MRAWRLSRFRDTDATFSGEGARRFAGRWHPAGVPVIYASSSLALAALEFLAHAEVRHLKSVRYAFAADVPDDLIEEPALSALPADWSHPSKSDAARAFGESWARAKRSVALSVPSILVPQERNLLLNPQHPDFPTVVLGGPLLFVFDRRLVKTAPARAPRRPRRP